MPKVDGEITRLKILEVAEQLFSENGFDATGMDAIAKQVGINKATIYYHFKDKNDIIISLFNNIIQEVEEKLEENDSSDLPIIEMIREEIHYLRSKKKILAVMLMETIKINSQNMTLFDCARLTIENEMDIHNQTSNWSDSQQRDKFYTHEFFTGFLPLIMYIVLEDKFTKYFECNPSKVEDIFLEAINKSHINSHY